MQPSVALRRRFRALVTEVLPHELPLIFTNDYFYLCMIENRVDATITQKLQMLREPPGRPHAGYSKPYRYLIRKERGSATELSVMHPRHQIDAAEFYDRFAETIVSSCSISPASLRRPTAIAQLNTPSTLKDAPVTGQPIVHEVPTEGEDELGKIVSFFVYRDFNLLSKFFDSRRYIKLEKKFSRLRQLDVSKCFYSVYTHTISWAVKDKDFAKRYAHLWAFEQQFDKLMQLQNYNETNGILVGPELSRIFSEIILQRIDLNLIAELDRAGHKFGASYAFLRYVDDYFVYANEESVLDLIQELLSRELSAYKLHINEGKVAEYSRPFVTALSAAKRSIHHVVHDLRSAISEVRSASTPDVYRNVIRKIRSKTDESRVIIGEHGIGFHNVSAWVLTVLRSAVFELVGLANTSAADDEDRFNCIERALHALFGLVFYIASLDLRVTTTYGLARILAVLKSPGFARILMRSDWLQHALQRELVDLLAASHETFFQRAKRPDSVETCNVLLIGAHYLDRDFVRNSEVKRVMSELAGDPTYFSYISLKFAMLRDAGGFIAELADLNNKVLARVEAAKQEITVRAEEYLMLCDLLSSPDLTYAEKRSLWKSVIGGNISNKQITAIARGCGFTDWSGLRIDHLIRRSRLRPVYE